MAQAVVALIAHPLLVRAWLALINIALRLGWKPSFKTANRMNRVAGQLVWTRTVVEQRLTENGWRTYRPRHITVRLCQH